MVKSLVKLLSIAFVVLVVAAPGQALAQVIPPPQTPAETISLAGPRFGATFLSNGIRGKLRDDADIEVGSMISQFGWQKEKRFLSSPNGLTGVTEWVVLFGGMDQGVVLPSFSWLVGMRSVKGVEFALGPNLSPGGVALAAAAGVTFRAGNLNIPLNVAAVPSKSGVRVSFLAGFNTRKR